MMIFFRTLCLLLCLASAVPALAARPHFSGEVVSVANGDTLTVLQGKQRVKIRLYGIDAPEKGQVFWKRARRAAADAVHGKTVTVQPMGTDRYGQTLAVILMPDGKSLNEHLVREGLAWVFPQYCEDEEICAPLRKLEQEARSGKRWLWQLKNPTPPWEWRKKK
jgi:endonuclease YncB( thermonuclease family)